MPATVLVVDDDPKFMASLCWLLAEAGYSTIEAPDGRVAFLALKSKKIDAAIVDLELPEVGGFQVIGEIAKIKRTSPIPLLAITGAYQDLYLEVAEYLGAQASIRKPEAGKPLTPIIEAFQRLMDTPRVP